MEAIVTTKAAFFVDDHASVIFFYKIGVCIYRVRVESIPVM